MHFLRLQKGAFWVRTELRNPRRPVSPRHCFQNPFRIADGIQPPQGIIPGLPGLFKGQGRHMVSPRQGLGRIPSMVRRIFSVETRIRDTLSRCSRGGSSGWRARRIPCFSAYRYNLAYIYALRRGYASGKRFVPRKAAVAFWAAFGGLMIIVAGVSFGIMTATESAAVAAFWSFLCAFFTGIFRCGNIMSSHPLPSRLYPPS